MTYTPYKGACLLMPYNEVPHLFFVLTATCPNGNCLITMLTSIKAGRYYDRACVLDVGDHDFIKAQSYILYRMAEQPRASHISKMVSKGYFVPRSDASNEVLIRVCDGLVASDDARLSDVKYAKREWER
jgi:hypothetical protein